MIQWSRGYENLRYYVRFAYWLTHKKIVVTGLENIPMDKPVIFAVNHQNALMDPMALVCTNKLQTIWLTRADVFKGKAAIAFLKFLKMIPVYRIRDGKENLANNEQIFNLVTEAFESGQSAALFPEAAHSGKRQMLSHKKAIPRIALEAEAKNDFKLQLKLVPVGIFYDHYWKLNRTVIVQYGEPIDLDAYKDRYAENQQNSMLVLRDEIYGKLAPLTLQINSTGHYALYEDIRMIAGKEFAKRKRLSKNPVLQLFKSEQELIARVEALEKADPGKFLLIKDEVNAYVRTLKKTGVTDDHVRMAYETSLLSFLFRMAASLLTFPLFAAGFLFSAIPYYIPRLFITPKLKDKAFVSSFHFALGLVLYPLFYLAESILTGLLTGSVPIAAAAMVAMPFAGKIAYQLMEYYGGLFQAIRLRLFKRKGSRKTLCLRQELLATLERNVF